MWRGRIGIFSDISLYELDPDLCIIANDLRGVFFDQTLSLLSVAFPKWRYNASAYELIWLLDCP